MVELLFLTVIVVICFFYLRRKKTPKLFLTLEFNNIKITGDIKLIGLKLAQKVTVTLKPEDRLGNPAQVEAGSVVFTSNDESVCTVVQNPDNELQADVFSQGVGVAQLDFSADADLGEGVVTISGFSAVEVLPLEAVGFGLEVGEPIDV